jgi:hypothetical protein
MDNGDNVLLASNIFKSFDNGVSTSGDGCMTIQDVTVSSGEDDGYFVTHTGSLVFKNSQALFHEVRWGDFVCGVFCWTTPSPSVH